MRTAVFPARLAAGFFYAVNPFVFDRLYAGQLGVLLGYALLPFAVTALDAAQESHRVGRAACWAGATVMAKQRSSRAVSCSTGLRDRSAAPGKIIPNKAVVHPGGVADIPARADRDMLFLLKIKAPEFGNAEASRFVLGIVDAVIV